MANRRRPLLTGLSRAREAQYTNRQMARIEASIEVALRREIARTMAELANHYDDTGRQSAIMGAHRAEIGRILERAYRAAFEKFGSRIVAAGKQQEKKFLFSGYDKALEAWIRTWSALKITEIAGTTYSQATKIISQATGEAIQGGIVGQAATGKLIRERMAQSGGVLSVARSRVIARTETHSAAMSASQIAAQESGLRLKKEWIAVSDDRTREDHEAVDGQTVGLNDDFDVGGEYLSVPGDPSGSAENIINCRCVVGYVVDDD